MTCIGNNRCTTGCACTLRSVCCDTTHAPERRDAVQQTMAAILGRLCSIARASEQLLKTARAKPQSEATQQGTQRGTHHWRQSGGHSTVEREEELVLPSEPDEGSEGLR